MLTCTVLPLAELAIDAPLRALHRDLFVEDGVWIEEPDGDEDEE
jgi:hypothetical protein